MTSVKTIFRKKLHAIRNSNEKGTKVTLLAINVQIKNVSKDYTETEFGTNNSFNIAVML